MQRMKLAKAIGLVVVLIVLGTMMGCGGKSKYVGKYVSEQNQSVLEIKRDDTYRFETKGMFGDVTTGEWRIVKEGGEETIDFIPGFPRGLMSLMKLKKSDNLVNVLGETFVKQD